MVLFLIIAIILNDYSIIFTEKSKHSKLLIEKKESNWNEQILIKINITSSWSVKDRTWFLEYSVWIGMLILK
jgi:hypothetical protein